MTVEEEERERFEKMTMSQLKEVAKDEGICLGYDGSRRLMRLMRFLSGDVSKVATWSGTNDLPKMSQRWLGQHCL